MARIFVILTIVLVQPLFALEARSQGMHSPAAKMSAQSGTCPTGSCAKDGSSYARYLKFCSPANCLQNRHGKKQTQR